MIEPIQGEKQCTRCYQCKPMSQFSPRHDRPGGRHPYCKTCRNTQAKDRAALGRRKDRKHREEIWPRKLGEALLDIRAGKWRYPVAPVALRWTA
jgi:hypothetical protein